MKILRLISSLNPKNGGPIEAARRIDTLLTERGHEVTVATLDADSSATHVSSYPGRVISLGSGRPGYGFSRLLKPWLKEHASEFDVAIINGLWQYHSFCARGELKKAGVPYFLFTHGMLDPWFKKEYPLKHLKKWLYWPWAEYRVVRDAEAVLFTSEEERRLARQSFWLYKCNELVVRYGTAAPPEVSDDAVEEFREKHDIGQRRLILFLSRIHAKKGCDMLIEAYKEAQLAESNEFVLMIAGPDQEGLKETFIKRATSLGIDGQIRWPGMLQGQEKWAAFNAADIFCLPSHQENFGIVVAEAMACGAPVLISNQVNIWREIINADAGLVCNDDTVSLTAALNKWRELDVEKKQAMGRAGKDLFFRSFVIEKVVDDLEKILFSTRKQESE